jgi:hypothetical protein
MKTKGKAVVYGVPYVGGGAGGGCLACPTFSGSALHAAGDPSSSAEGGVPMKLAPSIRFLSPSRAEAPLPPGGLRAARGLGEVLVVASPAQELTNGS